VEVITLHALDAEAKVLTTEHVENAILFKTLVIVLFQRVEEVMVLLVEQDQLEQQDLRAVLER
jgi:hypothetical protein